MACAVARIGFLWLLGVGCQGDQHPDVLTPVNSRSQLDRFSETLTRWYHSTSIAPTSVVAMRDLASSVIIGELSDVRAGRKELRGSGCVSSEGGEVEPSCMTADRDPLLYRSYVNLVITVDHLVKGGLEDARSDVYMEHPWPNNLEMDELRSATPFGTRLVVLGEPVLGALEKAEPLVQAGLLSRDGVEPNLVAIPSYGLVIEASDGSAVMPLRDNQEVYELVEEDERIRKFDGIVDVLVEVQQSL